MNEAKQKEYVNTRICFTLLELMSDSGMVPRAQCTVTCEKYGLYNTNIQILMLEIQLS